MAADVLVGQQVPVDDQPDPVPDVEEQLKSGDRAGDSPMYIDANHYTTRPTDQRIPQELAIYDKLEELSIPYVRVDHETGGWPVDSANLRRSSRLSWRVEVEIPGWPLMNSSAIRSLSMTSWTRWFVVVLDLIPAVLLAQDGDAGVVLGAGSWTPPAWSPT